MVLAYRLGMATKTTVLACKTPKRNPTKTAPKSRKASKPTKATRTSRAGKSAKLATKPKAKKASKLKAKKNPSDLPTPSLKFRAKKAAKAAAGSAKEKAKSAAKRAGAATSRAAKAGTKKGAEVAKKAAKAGAAKGAELTKRAAVYTGEKLKQGGKRVGRKAAGVAKEAWSGIVKGWKENPAKTQARTRWDGLKFEIDWLMGRVHVGTPDEEVRANIEKRCKKAGFDAKLTRRCIDYAIKAHRKNQQDYTDVMTGNFGPKRGKAKKNPTLYKRIASNPVPRAGGYIYRMAYETWDEEALEAGETDDRGWKVEESESYDTLESLLDSVSHDATWLEWSSSHPSSRDWIISESEQDYTTGDRTSYSLFIERSDGKPLTTAQLKLIDKKLRLRGTFGRAKPRSNPSQDQVHLSQKGKQWHVLLDKQWVPISDAEAKRQIESGEAVKVPWSHKSMAHHDRPDYIDPKQLGLMLQNWHYGQGDPIYAVGSSLFAGKTVPTETLADALGRIRSLKTSSTSRHDRKGHKELVTIEKSLEYLVGTRRAMAAGRKSNPTEKTVQYRGWTIEQFSGMQVGYQTYGRSMPKFGKGRKTSGWIAKHPEHMPNGKVVGTLKQAKEYIDEYMGPDENPASVGKLKSPRILCMGYINSVLARSKDKVVASAAKKRIKTMGPDEKSVKFLAWTNAPAAYDYWYVKDTGKVVNGFRLVEVKDKECWEQFQLPRYESGMNIAFPASDKASVERFGLGAKAKKNPTKKKVSRQDLFKAHNVPELFEMVTKHLGRRPTGEEFRAYVNVVLGPWDIPKSIQAKCAESEAVKTGVRDALASLDAEAKTVKSGGKVKARSITLTKLSGSKDVGKSVTLEGGNVWAKADRQLSLWAEPPAQEKVKFTVSYADAETYTGTYATGDELGGESLAGHIRMTLDAIEAASPSQISESERKKWIGFRNRYETGCKVCDNPAKGRFEAGVWEQGKGFVPWSSHITEAAAKKAALRYAKKQKQPTGGSLSWKGGVRRPDGSVMWFSTGYKVCDNPTTVTKSQVKKLLAQYKIPGQLSGKGSDWTLELPDEKAHKLWNRTAGKSVKVGGYRSGFGSWVLSPGYQSRGDWNDPSSRCHY